MPNLVRLALSALPIMALPAQTLPWKQVVPQSAATVEGASSTALPFGSSSARHVMFAYDGSTVGYSTPVRIRAISLRCDGAAPGGSVAGSYSFDLDLSTSRNAVTSLSTTFGANHGHDRLRVHSGVLAAPAPAVGSSPNAFSLRIPLTTPFDWDPRSGPLLLDVAYSASTPAFGAWDAATGGVATLAATGSASTVATSVLTNAPVLRLEVVGAVLPTVATTTEAATSTTFPWGRGSGQQMRTLNLYEPSAFGIAGLRRITGLAWRMDAGNAFLGRTFTVRISLSTSPKTSTTLDATFANDHGPDLTVVFDGVVVAPATTTNTDLGDFDLFIPLQRAFEYEPAAGSLAVDLQLFDCSGIPQDWDCELSGPVGRVSNTTSATSPTGSSAPQAGIALVMSLRTVPVQTVPQSLEFVTNTVAANSTAFPFGLASARTLLLVSFVEAGITGPFVVRHLRFRPGSTALAGGPSTFTMTVDLSHAATTPATISGTFDSNHGADRERVFDGQVSVPFFTRSATDTGFAIEVELQKPFLWDPSASQYLAIDLRVLSRVGPAIPIESTFGLIADDARITATSAAASSGATQSIAATMQLGGDSRNGLASNEGTGCVGLNGAAIASTIGLPSLPNPDLKMRVRNAAGNSAAFFIAGFAPVSVPLPGTNNCLVLHAGEVGILGAVVTDPSGDGVVPLPLIGGPQFDGFQFRGQWWILDPSANSLGIVTSDAQVYTARWF
ncbi:MAG TPA: hypothetical protein VFZ65_09470 [Planctomycetota bacterium]|nr:hypothetical protein [Planctomycetota bacterium]